MKKAPFGASMNLKKTLEWRKAAGVEPTWEWLTPPTGFEAYGINQRDSMEINKLNDFMTLRAFHCVT